jgi:hypothetical protein
VWASRMRLVDIPSLFGIDPRLDVGCRECRDGVATERREDAQIDEALVSTDGPGFQGRLCNREPVSHPFPEADAPEGGTRSLTAGIRHFGRRHEAFGLYPRLSPAAVPAHRAPLTRGTHELLGLPPPEQRGLPVGRSFGTRGCVPPLDVAYSSSLAVPAARLAGPARAARLPSTSPGGLKMTPQESCSSRTLPRSSPGERWIV